MIGVAVDDQHRVIAASYGQDLPAMRIKANGTRYLPS